MEKISLESPKTGSDLVLETLRDLGIDTILVILVVRSYLCMMRYTILKVFATSWDAMSKVVCTKLKDMPNQLESWALPSSRVGREQQMPLQGLQMP